MMKAFQKAIVMGLLSSSPAELFAQVPVKPGARKAVARSGVDTILALVKGGMSESLILSTIRSAGKAYQLSPEEMLRLHNGGVSDNVIQTMMNPAFAEAIPGNQVASPTTTQTKTVSNALPPATPFPTMPPNLHPVEHKRRIAVMPFSYAAVTNWVQYWFHSDYNIGQGIRAMLATRLAQAKQMTLVERGGGLDELTKELTLNRTQAVNKGTSVKTGKISGADCILLGEITIFGRDDKAESSHQSGVAHQAATIFGGKLFPRGATQISNLGTFSKEEKAVVGIALRIVDTESSEVLESAESRGESSRESKNWTSFTASPGTYQSNSGAMESSNFQATIIGEATSDAVNKVVAHLEETVPGLPLRTRTIEGRVAKISGYFNPILGFGSNQGVSVGDRLDILKIISEVLDPATKERLDVETVKVGEFIVTNVREAIATGIYGGEPLLESHAQGYTARLSLK